MRRARRFWTMVVMLAAPAAALAQGPLTAPLPEAEPAGLAYRVGPVRFGPNVAVREIGVDDNVFDEAENPKDDFMAVVSPDASAYVRTGMLQVVFATSVDFTYYQRYESERSVGQQYRGRVDLLLSRLRPSMAAAVVDSRTRPNQEIDLRARRTDRELTATVGFEVTPLARAYAGATRVDYEFQEGEVQDGVDLATVLNRRTRTAQAGIRMTLTPFTAVTVEGQIAADRFVEAPRRDSNSRTVTTAVTFGNEAIVSGTARVGYRDFRPVDPGVSPYTGLVTAINLSYVGFWRGRLSGLLERDVQYSFDESDGYYLATIGEVTYTQRLFGPMDAQAKFGSGRLDYTDTTTRAGRADRTRHYTVGVGYNRDTGARLGLSYEAAERDSVEQIDRRYTRRRLYGSLTYGF